MNIIKKLNIELPIELLNIIKDYCFYMPIQNKINDSTFSRKNGTYELDISDWDWNNNNFNTNAKYIEISPSNNTWIVVIPYDSLCFKASNCYICGNYISHKCDFELSNNIKCNC